METIRQDTIRGLKWSSIENISSNIVNFIVGLVLARLLSPSDFGVLGMLSLFFAISQLFINGGFSNALIRKTDRTETDCSTAFYFNIVIGFICCSLLFFCSSYISVFFCQPILRPICQVLSLTLVLNSLTIVQVALLTVKVDFKSLAIVSLFCSITSGLISIFFAFQGVGVWALVIQQITNATLRVPILWVVTRWYPKAHFSWHSFHTLFSYGSKLLASGLLQTLYTNMSAILIGKYYSATDLGYYTRGNSMASMPVSNITGILQRVSFPILAKLQNDEQLLISTYRKYIKLSSIPVLITMLIIASVAKPLVVVLLTEKWSEAIIFVQIFCITYIFDHITKLNLNLLQVIGRSDLFFRLELIKKILGFTLLFMSVPFGVMAICLSKLIYSQIALIINTYYTGKLFGLGYFSQFRDFFKYLLAGIISCFIPFIICQSSSDNYFILLSSSVILAVLTYAIILRNDMMFRDILGLFLHKTLSTIFRK